MVGAMGTVGLAAALIAISDDQKLIVTELRDNTLKVYTVSGVRPFATYEFVRTPVARLK